MTDKPVVLTSNGNDDAPRPWRLFKAGERSELPHIADANGRVVARAEGNLWVWQDFIAPMILAAVNAHETRCVRCGGTLVRPELCDECFLAQKPDEHAQKANSGDSLPEKE